MPDLPEGWFPLPMGSIDTGARQPAAAPPAAATREVGEEVQAYCPSPRCKSDQTHTIISTYEDEIRRVQCVSCGEVHAYRPARGVAEPVAAARPSWDDAMARFTDADRSAAPPYSIRTTYALNSLVQHPVFGVGVVVEVLPDAKVDVVFRDRTAVLVHGR